MSTATGVQEHASGAPIVHSTASRQVEGVTERDIARVRQVAGLLTAGNAGQPVSLSEAAALQVSNGGWSYEVRWPDGGYVSDTDYTRVEGDRLRDELLAAAVSVHEYECWCINPPRRSPPNDGIARRIAVGAILSHRQWEQEREE